MLQAREAARPHRFYISQRLHPGVTAGTLAIEGDEARHASKAGHLLGTAAKHSN